MTEAPFPGRKRTYWKTWLLSCSTFAFLTAGVVGVLASMRLLGGWFLFVWPLILSPLMFLPYTFLKRHDAGHLKRYGAAIGAVSAGIWTLLAIAGGLLFGLATTFGDTKVHPLFSYGSALVGVVSWPAVIWSALAGYLSVRLVKV